MKKIVQIQYSMESAGRAALRLQRAFAGTEIMSSIISLEHSGQESQGVKYLGAKARLIARAEDKIHHYLTRNVNRKLGSFSYPVLGCDLTKLDEVKNADVIYIHWALKGLLNFQSIEKIAKLNKPVIIFLHDMWYITGGCHHSFECVKFKTEGCHACPMFPGGKKNDLSAKGFRKKLRIYSRYNNLYFVSPGKWLQTAARESLLTKDKRTFHIPNLLDKNIFKPTDKKTARQILNVGTESTVIAFGAITVDSPYKGWAYLQKALELLKQDPPAENISILIFGSSYKKEIAEAIPFPVKFMGYLKDEYSTALVYNAADVFIAPSLAEAFGYVVMEALSCGTPVVGFDVGGIPDMVKHQQNGYLAKYKDADDLAAGIRYCIRHKLSGKLPPEIEPEYTVKKHLELLEQVSK